MTDAANAQSEGEPSESKIRCLRPASHQLVPAPVNNEAASLPRIGTPEPNEPWSPCLDPSTADELHRLADLKDRGVITDAEFERLKAKAVG